MTLNDEEITLESDQLLSNKYQTLSIDELLQQFKSSQQNGLSNIYARSVRKIHGPNKIKLTGECDCPPWLCCLLGLKQKSKASKLLDDCTPQGAKVLRDGKYKWLDSESVVVGDIVKVSSGEYVPADIRVLDVRIFIHSFIVYNFISNYYYIIYIYI